MHVSTLVDVQVVGQMTIQTRQYHEASVAISKRTLVGSSSGTASSSDIEPPVPR